MGGAGVAKRAFRLVEVHFREAASADCQHTGLAGGHALLAAGAVLDEMILAATPGWTKFGRAVAPAR